MSHRYAVIEPDGRERLFRRCRSSHFRNGDLGFWLFADGEDGMMSVDAERCRDEQEEREAVAATGWGLVAFPALLGPQLEQVLVFWPESDNLAHTQVVGEKPQSIKKKFLDGATLLFAPTTA